MKNLPLLLFAAFCVTAHAQEEDKELAASFLQPGTTYIFEFTEGAGVERDLYTIVSATRLPNWFLVENKNGGKFFLNVNTASTMVERNKDGSIIPEDVSKPAGTPASK